MTAADLQFLPEYFRQLATVGAALVGALCAVVALALWIDSGFSRRY